MMVDASKVNRSTGDRQPQGSASGRRWAGWRRFWHRDCPEARQRRRSAVHRQPVPWLGDPFGTRRSLLHRTHHLRPPSPTPASGVRAALDLTAPPPMRPLIAAAMAASADRGGADRPVLLVTSTYREAEELTAALECLLPPEDVAYYPAWETLPHERLSPRSDTVGRRLAVLRRLAGNDELPPPRVIVAPVRSVLQPQVKGLGDLKPVRLTVGDDFDLGDLAAALVGAAYVRVDLVERRGEFAVRGGIVDVFPPTEEHPVRVDFFGDTVEEIRYFSVADQRSGPDTRTEIIASPCRELLLTDDVRRRAFALSQQHPELIEMLDKIAQGHAVDGMEALSPALVDGMELLVELVPPRHPGPGLRPRAGPRPGHRPGQDQRGVPARLLGRGGRRRPGPDRPRGVVVPAAGRRPRGRAGPRSGLVDAVAVQRRSGHRRRRCTGPDRGRRDRRPEHLGQRGRVSSRGSIAGHAGETYRGDTESAINDIAKRIRDGWRVVLMAEGHGLSARFARGADRARPAEPHRGGPHRAARSGIGTVVTGGLSPRVRRRRDQARRLHRRRPVRPARRRTRPAAGCRPGGRTRSTRSELTPGDPVVHSQHGVGRYREMVQRTVAGATREYLVIEYAPSKRGQPGDRLYVPMDALDQVTRYVGGENPTLDKMGGADWAKRKGRARKAVREIAAELIKLYAARQATRGPRVRARHDLAARAGGRLQLRGDPRPAGRGRGGQARHGAGRADGPADLRRRRLRQDRDRGPGRVQGGAGRQAGGHPGADHPAGAAAPRHLRRPVRRLPDQRGAAVAVPERRRDEGDHRGAGRRQGRRRRRHPPAALARRSSSKTSAWW